jgi:hypothetical protein
MRELTTLELDAELAEQLPARELMGIFFSIVRVVAINNGNANGNGNGNSLLAVLTANGNGDGNGNGNTVVGS